MLIYENNDAPKDAIDKFLLCCGTVLTLFRYSVCLWLIYLIHRGNIVNYQDSGEVAIVIISLAVLAIMCICDLSMNKSRFCSKFKNLPTSKNLKGGNNHDLYQNQIIVIS